MSSQSTTQSVDVEQNVSTPVVSPQAFIIMNINFMTLSLVFLLMVPVCVADGGGASGSDGSSFYTFLITR